MKIVQTAKRFRKDYKKLKKSGGKDIKKLHDVMKKLIDGKGLSIINQDHQLQGQWKDFRDCHIDHDWILIYALSRNQKKQEIITFCATDNHSNLFQ